MATMNNGYSMLFRQERPPQHQGFFSNTEEVEQWAASGRVSGELLAFVRNGGDTGDDRIFVYTHTHAGSGSADPTAEITLQDGGVLDVKWYNRSTCLMQTLDLRFRPFVVAFRINPNIVKSVHVHGIQVTEHSFVAGTVKDEERAFDIIRGIHMLSSKPNDELRALTKITTEIADHSTLQALAFLPKLEELQTTGVHWTSDTLSLLAKLVTLKKLRVGGRYWSEPNNFKYSDLEALTSLTNLESLDLSYSAADGAKSHMRRFDEEIEQNPDKKYSREFARGMKSIMKFPKLKELILEAQMYPKGAKVLTNHPSLEAIFCAKNLSYEVVQILADSRLATQLTSLDFEGTRDDQLAGPIIAQIAKFVNLTHLGMRSVGTLDDAAMEELAPLVKLKELYIPSANITSEGLQVLRQIPNISVLSLGYCCGIQHGLDHIHHLSLTHLDLRTMETLTAEQLLPVIRASPNLVDLNLRYAENLDAKTIAKEELKSLKYLNLLSVGERSGRRSEDEPEKYFKEIGAKVYYEDNPFHILPNHLLNRH